jgi:hypothetical protein
MQTIFERPFIAIAFLLGAGASAIVLHFPWFSFLATILLWTAMRAPKEIGLGHLAKIPAARTVSDAAYEGLWAAAAIVFGVTLLFESVTALAWA